MEQYTITRTDGGEARLSAPALAKRASSTPMVAPHVSFENVGRRSSTRWLALPASENGYQRGMKGLLVAALWMSQFLAYHM